MTGLLAAAADHTDMGSPSGDPLGSLVNMVGLDQVLPGFTVNTVLGNPSSIAGLLPTLGFSTRCQNEFFTAAVSCLAEIQFLPMLFIDPKVGQVILDYLPANSTLNRTEIAERPSDAFDLLLGNVAAEAVGPNAASFTLTNDEIQAIINELLPQYKKLSPEGKISDRCCASIKPVVSSQCFCTQTFADYLYLFLRTPNNDLNPYLPFFRNTFNGLDCDALDDLVFYPSDKCASCSRWGTPC